MLTQKASWKDEYFSRIEEKNQVFKRVALGSAVLFLGVIALLVFQIASAMR